MLFETMERLCALPGVSGCEQQVRYEILNLIEGHCIYRVDPLGNILCYKKGAERSGQKVLFSAHMDEVGLIVTYAEENGLLRFAAVGGVDRRALAGKAVRIGDTLGVIGMKAVHQRTAEEKEKAPEIKNLGIDIGAKNREEALSRAPLGSRAVFVSGYTEFGDGMIRGKALDDRAGCALLVELIRSELPYDLHFAFTVQEESGCTGAKTAAAQIAPDIGVAVEATTACDIPGVEEAGQVCRVKGGPVISFMDKGTVYDAGLYRRILRLAADKGIACQSKTGVYGGNESRSVQAAGAGARVAAVSLPCRYLHTPSCVVSRSDMEETLRLLTALCGELPR